jgi:hypothetical protein
MAGDSSRSRWEYLLWQDVKIWVLLGGNMTFRELEAIINLQISIKSINIHYGNPEYVQSLVVTTELFSTSFRLCKNTCPGL